MRLRCILCSYADGSEVLRWFVDDGPWAQQIFKMRLPDGPLEHTGDNPSNVAWLAAWGRLDKEGRVLEL